MFTIEDFRDAPMRVLGIADTANDVPAVVKALGLEGAPSKPLSAGARRSAQPTTSL